MMNHSKQPLSQANRVFTQQVGTLHEKNWSIPGRIESSAGIQKLLFSLKGKVIAKITQGTSTALSDHQDAGLIPLNSNTVIWRLQYGPWEDCRKAPKPEEYCTVYRVLQITTLSECKNQSQAAETPLSDLVAHPALIHTLNFPKLEISGPQISVYHNGRIWNEYQSEISFLAEFPDNYHRADHEVFRSWKAKPNEYNTDYFQVSVQGDRHKEMEGTYYHNPFPAQAPVAWRQSPRGIILNKYSDTELGEWKAFSDAYACLPKGVAAVDHPMFAEEGQDLVNNGVEHHELILYVGESWDDALFTHTYKFFDARSDWVPGEPALLD